VRANRYICRFAHTLQHNELILSITWFLVNDPPLERHAPSVVQWERRWVVAHHSCAVAHSNRHTTADHVRPVSSVKRRHSHYSRSHTSVHVHHPSRPLDSKHRVCPPLSSKQRNNAHMGGHCSYFRYLDRYAQHLYVLVLRILPCSHQLLRVPLCKNKRGIIHSP
jgi:hypothetical protein